MSTTEHSHAIVDSNTPSTASIDLSTLTVAGLRKLASNRGIGTGGWRVSATRDQLINAITLGHVPTPTPVAPAPASVAPAPVAPSASTVVSPAIQPSRPAPVLVYPDVDPSFVVSKEVAELVDVVLQIPNGKIRNVLVTGPAGCGKTELARHSAATVKSPFFEFSMPLYREPLDLFGEKCVADGKTFFLPSLFIQALETPHAVILLDEVNRVVPLLANGLLPLLDHRKEVYVEGLNRIVRVAENVTFFATANIGVEYTGTFRLDSALASRFPYRIEVTYLDRESESKLLAERCGITPEDAQMLATVAETIRAKSADFGGTLSHSVSTRELIGAGWLVAGGLPTGKALTHTIVPTFDPEGAESSERAQVLQTVQLVCGL